MKTLDKCGFGGILADDMGLGKTIQVIALFEDAYSSGEKAPSLVVCPASLVFNWEQEIQKLLGSEGTVSGGNWPAENGTAAKHQRRWSGLSGPDHLL